MLRWAQYGTTRFKKWARHEMKHVSNKLKDQHDITQLTYVVNVMTFYDKKKLNFFLLRPVIMVNVTPIIIM